AEYSSSRRCCPSSRLSLHSGETSIKKGEESKSGSDAPIFGPRIGKTKLRILIPAKRNKGRRKSHESDRHSQAHRRPGPSSHPQRDPPHHAHPRGRPLPENIVPLGTLLRRHTGGGQKSYI